MAKKSKKNNKLRQNYLPIVVLNNNVKSPKSKKVNKRRKVFNRSSDIDSGQFSNDKDTVVYIQNYPPPGASVGGRIDESFERRLGSGNNVKAVQPYTSNSELASYQLPVASADSGYGGGGGGGGGGCGYGGCGGGQELSLFEGLIFLAALAAAGFFLNNQIIMFIGKRRKRGEGLFDFFADMFPFGK